MAGRDASSPAPSGDAPSRGAPPQGPRHPGGETRHAPCRLTVLTAGVRQPSATALLADLLGGATRVALGARGYATDLVTVELRPHAMALADAMVTGQVAPPLARVIDSVIHADGLIAVTPTFAGSYAGLFKSFFDVLDRRALTGMPVLLGASGGSARHSLVIEYAMRPLLSYFHAVVAPTGVFAAADDVAGAMGGAAVPATLAARVDRAAAEMADLVIAGRRGGPERVAGPGLGQSRVEAAPAECAP